MNQLNDLSRYPHPHLSPGELGALDPARVSIVLPTSKLSKQLAALRAGNPSGGAGPGQGAGAVTAGSSVTDSKSLQKLSASRENLAPWEVSVVKMGMSILEDHLVPELKSTTLAHDRTCFAIQDILRELGKHVGVHGDKEDKPGAGTSMETGTGTGTGAGAGADSHSTGGSTSVPGGSKGADASEGGGRDRALTPSGSSSHMPEPLRLCLLEGQVLEITEPFWITNYTMRPLEKVLESPIYRCSPQGGREGGRGKRFNSSD